jgi:hypothetical protein
MPIIYFRFWVYKATNKTLHGCAFFKTLKAFIQIKGQLLI